MPHRQVQNLRNINDLPVQAGNANELVLLTPGVVKLHQPAPA